MRAPRIMAIIPIIKIDFLSFSEAIIITGIDKHSATMDPSSHHAIPGKLMNEITCDTKKYWKKAERFALLGNFIMIIR